MSEKSKIRKAYIDHANKRIKDVITTHLKTNGWEIILDNEVLNRDTTSHDLNYKSLVNACVCIIGFGDLRSDLNFVSKLWKECDINNLNKVGIVSVCVSGLAREDRGFDELTEEWVAIDSQLGLSGIDRGIEYITKLDGNCS